MERKITEKEALDYEIRSSWWAPLIPWDWAHKVLAGHFYRKVKRKHARYEKSKQYQLKKILENGY